MKKITMYFMGLVLSVLVMNVVYGQTPATQDSQNPQMLTDKATSDRLNSDWKSRNPTSQSQSIQWYALGDGYYGYYNEGSTHYTTFYDKEGSYIQTYRKADWAMVAPEIKSSYDMSEYKDREVTGYWESSDPRKKGSYLELKSNDGKVSRVWVDDKGEFSSTFGKTKPKS